MRTRRAAVGSAGRRQLTPKQREKREARLRAYRMRLEGKPLQEIADELGWSSPSGVSYALRRARKDPEEAGPVENAEELRQLNFWRLEKLLTKAFPPALGIGNDGKRQQPDLKSQDLVRRIIHDENKLMGVYDLPPSEGHDGSPRQASATEPDWPDAILVAEIDLERFRAALARSARNEPISVDDQPPAGYIAPRPDPVDDAPDSEGRRTGQRRQQSTPAGTRSTHSVQTRLRTCAVDLTGPTSRPSPPDHDGQGARC